MTNATLFVRLWRTLGVPLDCYADSEEDGPEKPVDESNHALAALRYLVMKIDAHKMAKPWYKLKKEESLVPDDPTVFRPTRKQWLSIYNEALWTPVCTIPRY